VVSLLEGQRPEPLARVLPVAGEEQPPLPPDFAAELRAFCLAHADELLALAASHRYQMSEPARCAHLLPAVAAVAADAGRPLALVDIGTGAGFALHLDAYRYSYDRDDGDPLVVGAADAPVTLHTTLRGPRTPPLPAAPPAVAVRIGVDTEPLDVGDPSVRAWLRACTPPVAEALLRFDRAADHAAAHPVTTVRADALRALPEVIEGLPDDVHPCVLDAYVNVFFTDEGQARFRDRPSGGVLGAPLPPGLLERARTEGVFGVLERVSYRRGRADRDVLALGHPGGAWLEWLAARRGSSRAAPPGPPTC
jgi:hypothetical protein